jgi:DNA ligase-1
VPIGKAYSGLTDDEIERLTRRLEGLTIDRRGGLRLVRPEVVLEVAFDGVQRSSRHASGFALRFPRFARLRDDKAAADADRIEAVEAIFASQVASGHREPSAARTRASRKSKDPKKTTRQLSLFDDEIER